MKCRKLVFVVVIHLTTSFLFCPSILKSQDQLGIIFSKRCFVQDIAIEAKAAIVNVVDNEGFMDGRGKLSEMMVYFSDPLKNNAKLAGGITSMNDLRSGLEIEVKGEYFRNKNYILASSITVLPPDKSLSKITNGRIDAVGKDCAVIDGHKVKLNSQSKIKGLNGFQDKSFAGLASSLTGETVAVCEGNFDVNNFFVVNTLEIAPDEVTEVDEKLVSSDLHKLLSSKWGDAEQRKALYGQEIAGVGVIYNNDALQMWVNEVGQKLLTPQMKQKLNFVFVVVDNPAFNATVQPSGLSYVYTGLFSIVKNEAQLAAVLGHEITHAIYEHTAESYLQQVSASQKVEKKKAFLGKLVGAIGGLTDIFPNTIKALTGKSAAQLRTLPIDETAKVLGDMAVAKQLHKLSHGNIEQELQCDRVGLYLMVRAGYDPREAAKVWREVYNAYGSGETKVSAEHGKGVVVDLGNASQEATSITGAGMTIVNGFLARSAKKKATESNATHPDNIRRFRQLNNLVNLYWSDPDVLATSTLGRSIGQ
jgi:hypothetical protein